MGNQPTSKHQQIWIGARKDTSLPSRIKDNADPAGLSHPLALWKDNTSVKPDLWCLLANRTWLIAAKKTADATVETCNSPTTTSNPTKESTLNPAILIKPEIVLAVTMLPTLELPSLATKSSHPGMKMLSSTLLPPSVHCHRHRCLSILFPILLRRCLR